AGHRLEQPLPTRALLGQLPAAGGRESVDLDALLVARDLPLGRHRPLPLETVEGGIQRSGVHPQRVARAGADRLRDPVAVLRSPRQRLEDEQVEGSLEQLDRVLVGLARLGHVDSLHPYAASRLSGVGSSRTSRAAIQIVHADWSSTITPNPWTLSGRV